ncbi:MAG: DUF1963 domain-containing protein [Phycisphaerales bacterium]|nr:DUF1963 domain-containing protein [Phycisphaerales bacterium]
MIHPPVDIARWIARNPLAAKWARLDAEGAMDFRYEMPSDICSPRDLALTEQFRDAAGGPDALWRGVNVDVLLPALGEPQRPEVSKVGGVPYRPRAPWPTDASGRPHLFLAQLCLADSTGALSAFRRRQLPGDVLLIFCEDDDDLIWSESSGSRLHFEWQPLGIRSADLMGANELPPRGSPWTPTYFELHRSTDHAGAAMVRHRERELEVHGTYRSSKIGGLPAWQQGKAEAKGLGRYFASIHSIDPAEDEYPFPNVPTPPWGTQPCDQGFLMLGDVGTLYLFAKGGGRVGWLMQCG